MTTPKATIKVGKLQPQEVTELNNKIYLKAKTIMKNDAEPMHVGWMDVSKFIKEIQMDLYTVERGLIYFYQRYSHIFNFNKSRFGKSGFDKSQFVKSFLEN